MAKGFMQTGTTVAQNGTFAEKLADASWPVNGIGRFISVDDAGEPIFSTKFGDQLKLSFELKVVGQDQTLACSLRPAEFYALAMAFGVDLKGVVTPKNRLSSEVIQRVVKLINEKGKSLTVNSRNGWVNYVRAATPPEGLYTIALATIRRPDYGDGLDFQMGEYGPELVFEFEIVGDGTGRSCVWDGFRFIQHMNDPFVESALVNGEEMTVTEAGMPLFQNKDGFITRLAQRWQAFIKHFAPGALEHDWTTDPVQSKFGRNELLAPQYVIKDYAEEAGARKILHYTMRKNKANIDLLELDSLNPDVVNEDEDTEQPAALLKLVELIERSQPGSFVNSKPGSKEIVFSESGRLWAQHVLKPMWDKAGLGDKRPLHELTEAEANKLIAQMVEPAAKEEEKDEPELWPS